MMVSKCSKQSSPPILNQQQYNQPYLNPCVPSHFTLNPNTHSMCRQEHRCVDDKYQMPRQRDEARSEGKRRRRGEGWRTARGCCSRGWGWCRRRPSTMPQATTRRPYVSTRSPSTPSSPSSRVPQPPPHTHHLHLFHLRPSALSPSCAATCAALRCVAWRGTHTAACCCAVRVCTVERNPRIVETLKGKVVDYMNRAEELKALIVKQQSSSYALLLVLVLLVFLVQVGELMSMGVRPREQDAGRRRWGSDHGPNVAGAALPTRRPARARSEPAFSLASAWCARTHTHGTRTHTHTAYTHARGLSLTLTWIDCGGCVVSSSSTGAFPTSPAMPPASPVLGAHSTVSVAPPSPYMSGGPTPSPSGSFSLPYAAALHHHHHRLAHAADVQAVGPNAERHTRED
jgi:hypothetical protein